VIDADQHGMLKTYTYRKCRCPACKAASATYAAQRRAKDPVARRRATSVYRAKYRDALREASARWRAEHPAAERETKARYYADHRAAASVRNANWRAKNRSALIQAKAKYQAEHPDLSRTSRRRRRALERTNAIGAVTATDVRAILAENGGRCVYCDKRPATTLDHRVPLSRGGAHAVFNLAGACQPCNSSKGSKLVAEWKRGELR
jgi:5-methylcytosine-specific restriction endonuclease McrA